MLHLRNDHPINNKLHRVRPIYTSGICRLAGRAFRFVHKEWRGERMAEVNQFAWNTTPVCSDVRVGR
jgi:hypothetical protein